VGENSVLGSTPMDPDSKPGGRVVKTNARATLRVSSRTKSDERSTLMMKGNAAVEADESE
jgi:hypothetical protein